MKKLYYDNFLFCGFLWILLVSMLDHYLAIKLQSTLYRYEKNPIGLWLIKMDNGDVALFMTLKMLFLWFIFYFILKIYEQSKHVAYLSIIVLSLVQLMIVLYFVS